MYQLETIIPRQVATLPATGHLWCRSLITVSQRPAVRPDLSRFRAVSQVCPRFRAVRPRLSGSELSGCVSLVQNCQAGSVPGSELSGLDCPRFRAVRPGLSQVQSWVVPAARLASGRSRPAERRRGWADTLAARPFGRAGDRRHRSG